MKEFCLIPRSIAEKYIFKKNNSSNTLNPPAHPPSPPAVNPPDSPLPIATSRAAGLKKARKGTVMRRKKIYIRKKEELPSLDHLITGRFATIRQREAGRAFLAYLKSSGGIVWDEKGNLISPMRNQNIVNIIHDLVGPKAFIAAHKIPDYKLFLDHFNIQPELIENIKARNQLFKVEWDPY